MMKLFRAVTTSRRLSKVFYSFSWNVRLRVVEKPEQAWMDGEFVRLRLFCAADGLQKFARNNAGEIPNLESGNPEIRFLVMDLFYLS
jgi:hypothetical protein